MPSLTSARVPARPVAVARVMLGVATMMIAVEGQDISQSIVDGRVATPVAGWLPSPEQLGAYPFVLTVLAGLLIALGVGTRWWAAVVVVCELAVMLSDLQLYSNHRVLLVLVMTALVLARSDTALAPGARHRRGQTVPWWPQLLMLASVSSCYLFAGISKINPEWWGGSQLDDLRLVELSGLPLHGLAAATVLTEITIGIGLWFRRSRGVAVALGIGLHTSICLTLTAPFVFVAFALICFSAYPLALNRPDLADLASDEAPPVVV